MKRGLLATFSLLALACQSVPNAGGPDPIVDPDAGGLDPSDAPFVCAPGTTGCPCSGEPPRDCYRTPTGATGGETVCGVGTRYCRAGIWSGCEGITEFVIHDTASALLTGPSICNPCDPRCFSYSDVPGAADLTPMDSMGAVYDPSRGGIGPVATAPVTTPLPDSDGDGVPDVADQCVGPGAFTAADGSCYGSTFFYHTLAYGSPPVIDVAPINIQIRTADIYFLMDTTGSMGGELSNLQAGLTTGSYIAGCGNGVIGAIRCTMPDAWFGVGFHDDVPYCSGSECYGSAGLDLVYRNRQDISASLPAAQAAVNGLVIHSGADAPESQIPALWSIATGLGLGTYNVPRVGCPAGTFGYPCFRAGAIPIIVYITDAPFHNGPAGAYPYRITVGAGSGGASSTTVAVTTHTQAEGFGASFGDAGPVYDLGDATTVTRIATGSTNNATVRDDHNYGCGAGARDAGFRFTLTATTTVLISLGGSDYDTSLAVYNAAGSAGWCNDDSIGLQSALTLTLTAGTYYVLVDGYSTNVGNYSLSVGPAGAAAVSSHPTFNETAAALAANSIRVIAVQSCGAWTNSYCLEGESHARQLGTASGSLGSSGSPYVLRVNSDGTGLSSAIVSAITDLANFSAMDITARPSGDTMGFTQGIAAVSWGPGTCSGISGGTTFLNCLPGAHVNFNVTFRNNVVMQTMVPQVFTFYIEVVGNGSVILARIPVRIVVPPTVGGFAPTATYWHDYDSTTRCAIDERPVWGTLSWTAAIPAGTSITVGLSSADSLAALPTATPVATVNLSNGSGTANIAAALQAAGALSQQYDLRAFVTMSSDATHTIAPVLSSLGVTFTCVPAE